jgi:hypothetical protein
MLKSKVFIIVLLVLTTLFCFYPTQNSMAGSCDEKASNGGTSTFSGNFNIPPGFECPENPTLEYDTVNSAETIARNGSAAIVVIGNNGPYTWSVSGTGFTLETEGQPTGQTNTLHADGTACGSATITVTGCSGPPVTGYVRCTTGVWDINYTLVCGDKVLMSGPGGCTGVIDGKFRWYTACTAAWQQAPNCNEAAATTPCGSGVAYCVSQGGKICSVSYQVWKCP